MWVYDFGLRIATEDIEEIRDDFQDAFLGVWRGELEDDRLNGLVLAGALTGRQITIIRAIAKYLRQAGIAFSDAYMERTLLAHPKIATLLVRLFVARFDPDRADPRDGASRPRPTSKRRSTRSGASTRTGSCAASCRWCARFSGRTTSAARWRHRKTPMTDPPLTGRPAVLRRTSR